MPKKTLAEQISERKEKELMNVSPKEFKYSFNNWGYVLGTPVSIQFIMNNQGLGSYINGMSKASPLMLPLADCVYLITVPSQSESREVCCRFLDIEICDKWIIVGMANNIPEIGNASLLPFTTLMNGVSKLSFRASAKVDTMYIVH